jgi:hypothetical protein
MFHVVSLPLAEISGAQWIAITAIISGILLTAVIIVYGLKFALRRQELWHETARVALEKGQPLPPMPGDMNEAENPEQNSDIRTGLIMIAVGAGLYLFFLSLFGGWMKYVGAIPGFIGVALLLYGLFSGLNRKNPPAGQPPQS